MDSSVKGSSHWMASNSLFHSQKLSAKDQEESESSAETAAKIQ